MLETSEHGGGCCGITHLWNFPDGSKSKKGWLNRIYEAANQGHMISNGELVEVVLVDQQLRRKNLVKALEKLGFYRVVRFKNPNSGNYCNVFHCIWSHCDEEDDEE